MNNAIEDFKDYTGVEDDDVARQYLERAGSDPQAAMALYFEAQHEAPPTAEVDSQGISASTTSTDNRVTDEAVRDFLDFTAEDDTTVEQRFLHDAGNDHDRAVELYFKSQENQNITSSIPVTKDTPTAEAIHNFMTMTIEESEDLPRKYLARTNNNNELAIQRYFDARSGPVVSDSPSIEVIEDFMTMTTEESEDIVRKYLRRANNDSAAAIQPYFQANTEPCIFEHPSAEAIEDFMTMTTEENEDIAREYLTNSNNDSTKAIDLYFHAQNFQTQNDNTYSHSFQPKSPVPTTKPEPVQTSHPRKDFMNLDDIKQRWLTSEPTWTPRLGEGWQGIKVLGQGGFGIAGLWRLQDATKQSALRVSEVVVKQSQVNRPRPPAGRPETDLPVTPIPRSAFDEGKILQMLAALNSKHIVKQYGSNMSDTFDNEAVVRIFLEFCPGGDLNRLREVQSFGDKTPQSLEEVDIWAIFHCLAFGIAAMDRGSEDVAVEGPRDPERDLVHFDMKPQNVLMGNHDVEHVRIPVCKIADFGEALELPQNQDDEAGRKRYWRGDFDWMPPEENSRNLPIEHPRKGTCTNIYQAGCIIYSLMIRRNKLRGFSPPYYRTAKSNPRNVNLLRGLTHGIDLEQEANAKLYSATLRELVMECMMRESLLRPGSIDLQVRTKAGLESCEGAVREVLGGGFFVNADVDAALTGVEEPLVDLVPGSRTLNPVSKLQHEDLSLLDIRTSSALKKRSGFASSAEPERMRD